MKPREQAVKEKEKLAKLKALRQELETELEEQLSSEDAEAPSMVEVQKIDTSVPLEPDRAKQVVEALLFASSKPLVVQEIRRVVRGYAPREIEVWIQELKEAYIRENRGFEVLEIAGGYEIATKREFAPWIVKIELQKRVRQATQSALETLAILAYKQPITRAEIEDLRGVDVSAVLTTLMERGLIKIVGKKEIPGRPFLYGTTDKFLEHFGLNSLQDLPSIDEIKTMVENSVKKEDLLGKTQIVEVPQGENPPSGESQETSQENDRGSETTSQEN